MPRVINLHDELIGSAVLCDRTTDFGNPFKIGPDGTRALVLAKHAAWFLRQPALIARVKKELKGKDLACWCAPKACHCDVYLRIANPELRLLFRK